MDLDVYGKFGDVHAGMVARHAHVVKYNSLLLHVDSYTKYTEKI